MVVVLIGLVVSIYLIRKWSEEWNEKFETSDKDDDNPDGVTYKYDDDPPNVNYKKD